MITNQTSFSRSRQQRDKFCQHKDTILVPILKDIKIDEPKNFHAILMPALYGIEAFHLVSCGVPAFNLFAIENNSVDSFDIHAEIINCKLSDRQELKGMQTTGKPEPLSKALDEAYWCFGGKPFNLIYLDFLSQLDFETHYRNGLLKIMRARMLAEKATLIVNFGRNRCREKTANMNKDLLNASKKTKLGIMESMPIKLYIGAAIQESGHPIYQEMFNRSYLSMDNKSWAIEYLITVVKF